MPAKLYFYYSTMNAGKSTVLLQSAHNYRERGMDVLLCTPSIDDRYGRGRIASRIGLSAEAFALDPYSNLLEYVSSEIEKNSNIHCVLVDEAHFLKKAQIAQLKLITIQLHRPVLAYGLRTDFQGELFEGSQYLLAWSDKLIELKTICHCGSKATMVLRLDKDGKVVKTGDQVLIGGNDQYVSVCYKHFLLEEPHNNH